MKQYINFLAKQCELVIYEETFNKSLNPNVFRYETRKVYITCD